MSLMGFQKKKYLDRGVGGWVELYPIFFWIFGIFLTLQSPLVFARLLRGWTASQRSRVTVGVGLDRSAMWKGKAL